MRTKLAWMRSIRGLSQGQLAKKAGVCANSIKHIEQGRRRIDDASCKLVYALATALECPMEELLDHFEED